MVCLADECEKARKLVLHQVIAAGVAVLLASTTLISCGSDEASFCDSARRFEQSVRELDVEQLVSTLDKQFWADLLSTIDDLAESDSGELRSELQALREEVTALDQRLATVDYNLIAAALDPETATSYLAIAAALVLFAADQLQAEIDTTC